MGWILALESSLSEASIALWHPAQAIGLEVRIAEANKAAERLVPEADALLKAQGLVYADLAAIAVTTGPGSFTGVRIALAAAQGMALAIGCPLLPVSSLQAMAQAKGWLALMDQARGQVGWQHLGQGEPVLVDYADVWAGQAPAGIVLAQPGLLEKLPPNPWGLQPVIQPPSALLTAKQAWQRWQESPDYAIAADRTDALYLRAPDAKVKSA